ncbi:hypothetical protein GCM10010517_25920 [Streptosporangium fragile]|uniref:Uncharacterized protein n=1 Tax=Streptosporangium fragile TaxID=46186 RepID=A0ABN3VW21_9ACTN
MESRPFSLVLTDCGPVVDQISRGQRGLYATVVLILVAIRALGVALEEHFHAVARAGGYLGGVHPVLSQVDSAVCRRS